jgi:hypothetical protein
LKWHPTEPAEDFSFFDIRAAGPVGEPVAGLIYYPHPDTKPVHFQQPDVLELLLRISIQCASARKCAWKSRIAKC